MMQGTNNGMMSPRSARVGTYPGRPNAASPQVLRRGAAQTPSDVLKYRSYNASNLQNPTNPQNVHPRKRRLADRVLPLSIIREYPQSEGYMKLLQMEKKMDSILTHRKLTLQEAFKKPLKIKHKLRIIFTTSVSKCTNDSGNTPSVPMWEMRVEGKLLDENGQPVSPDSKNRKKFSTYFKSLCIKLDPDLYGPDTQLVEWHRTVNSAETDGFQVKRPGDQNVKCSVYLYLDHQPQKFRLEPRLARLLGIHTASRAKIIYAMWNYIKTHNLQDGSDRNSIVCDSYLEQIFQVPTIRFNELPSRLLPLQQPPDPIVINHLIKVKKGETTVKAFDIDVELDDIYKSMASNFLQSNQTNAEIAAIDNKIYEIIDQINHVKCSKEFFSGFSDNPQAFITKWIASQSRDLKAMYEGKDQNNINEAQRYAKYYCEPWTQEAVLRYIHNKLNERRVELEQALGLLQ